MVGLVVIGTVALAAVAGGDVAAELELDSAANGRNGKKPSRPILGRSGRLSC
jgi:hypothetical protein